ncbi:asparagine synthase-related protein, partial [Salmonella enterica subsp. enterica serovar Virginia]|nr:asparagine synthase-related protein [Salmonella enterica subsp. enterica serovar Virginia]
KASGSAVILVKAMVSFGQMIYPLIVSALLVNHIWYGYAVVIPRECFESYLPASVAWRQKEQFSDGVGYSWIDTLKEVAAKQISD